VVDYNAAGSGGSNKGPTNQDYLNKDVKGRIDTFLKHNPTVKKADIPAELVTASGSGLDPDLSPEGAKVQAARIAKARGLSEQQVLALVDSHTEKPLLRLLGPEKVNVLKLNVALDELKK
jgi:K+-transporting ATPase ATPase C chain